MELGKNIAKLRKLHNIKAKDLARQVDVGQPFISEIESGRKVPSLEVLQKIARILNTTTSELLGETPIQLDAGMARLVKATSDLSDAQIDAIIAVVHAFKGYESNEGGHSFVAEEE